MTAFLREWILGIVAVSLISAFAMSLAGEASARRVIRLISALALLLAVLLPLKGVDESLWKAPFAEYERIYERKAGKTTESAGELMCELTSETLEEYVVELAASREIACTAEVSVELCEGYAQPSSCTIFVETEADAAQLDAFCEALASTLAIDEVYVTGR